LTIDGVSYTRMGMRSIQSRGAYVRPPGCPIAKTAEKRAITAAKRHPYRFCMTSLICHSF